MEKKYICGRPLSKILAFIILNTIYIPLIIIGFMVLFGINDFVDIGLFLCIIGLPISLICWYFMMENSEYKRNKKLNPGDVMKKEDILKKDFIKIGIIFDVMLGSLILMHLLFPDLMNKYLSISIVFFCLGCFYNSVIIVFALQLKRKKNSSLVENGMRSTQKPLN